ncbi:hypothetical protein F5Y10DRAFT_263867 [Nemania abortiva]|nr:hypothetical protein F5Y10DRAFT_263867 [Nemania abortiva]
MDASNVFFNPSRMYARIPRLRVLMVELVIASAPAEAVTAEVLPGWHTGLRDGVYPEVTVNYFNADGLRIDRRHIYC